MDPTRRAHDVADRSGGAHPRAHIRQLLSHPAAICLLICSFLFPFKIGRAEDGRDFAGQYAISNPVESNGTVTAALALRIVNYSGSDIQGARILTEVSGIVIAENVGFSNHTHFVIRTVVTLPAPEFAEWQQGPRLVVEWHDTDGSLVRRPVELLPSAAIPEVK